MNLNVIGQYKKKFPKLRIGLSDHENGIDASTIAYMLGARVFEKHFTLNRANKGTDNSFSLEPQGLAKMIRNLKRIKILLGDKNKKVLKNELAPLFKMKKSIVIKEKLKKGSIVNKRNVTFKSPGKGLDPYLVTKFIGKKINCDLNKDDYLFLRHIKNGKKN
jgi:N-acetylneuraminate synthase/sialic acid synthase